MLVAIVVVGGLCAWRVNVVNQHNISLQHLQSRGAGLISEYHTTLTPKWIDHSKAFRNCVESLPESMKQNIIVEAYGMVHVDGRSLSQVDVEAITDLKGLLSVSIYEITEDLDLSPFLELSHIEYFTLYKGRLSGHQIEILKSLDYLKELRIAGIKIDITEASQLRTSLADTNVLLGDDDIELLQGMDRRFLKE